MNDIKLTVNPINRGDVFSVKILATFLSYSSVPNIAYFWESEKCSYCLWGDNMTISGEADEEFLKFISPKTILCSQDNADMLKLEVLQSGQIMQKNIIGIKKEVQACFFENSKEIFALFKSCELMDDYENFLLDTSHKMRRELALLDTEKENEKTVSAVLSSYITEDCAIITAVATAKNYRQNGFARKAILKTEEKLSGRKIFLLKENNKNNEFYSKMNYKVTGNWILGKM